MRLKHLPRGKQGSANQVRLLNQGQWGSLNVKYTVGKMHLSRRSCLARSSRHQPICASQAKIL